MSNPTPSNKSVVPSVAPVKAYTITLGDKVKVTKDSKSKSRVINFPFEFPDGTNGVIILCRIKDDEWQPSRSIKNIVIEFT